MVGRSPRINCSIASVLGAQIATKKKTIVVGLKTHNRSREVLLRVLNRMISPGDNVLAIHVQEPQDSFDPNTFQIHEDLCKSKQVEFQIKICDGESFIAVLTDQARQHFATELVLGCNTTRPEDSIVPPCLKRLPPSCSLLIINNVGKILIRKPGTSQEGSISSILQTQSLKTYKSPATWLEPGHKAPKLEAKLSSSKAPSLRHADMVVQKSNNGMQMQSPATMEHNHLQRIAILEAKGACKRFTPDELRSVTDEFSPQMVIEEGGHGKVYRAQLGYDGAAAVKVLNITPGSGEELLREVEILSELNHEHIIRLIGYCYCMEMQAVVYNLLQGSLKQKLRRLTWRERVKVAVGLAKALEYLHHSCSPPIIHSDVNSSNILLSHHCQPQLSDFGEAIVCDQPEQPKARKPVRVVGTFGYLAPEYIMYGKVDERTDVYSFGIVLLELITGREATDADHNSNHASLVPWARSLLSQGLCEKLIDPYLQEDYNKEEMQRMMTAVRLCLMHSSSRRPTMKVILKLLEGNEYWPRGKCRGEFINWIGSKGESPSWRHNEVGSRITCMEDI